MRSFLRNRRFKNFASKSDVLCFCLLLNSNSLTKTIPSDNVSLEENYKSAANGLSFYRTQSAADAPTYNALALLINVKSSAKWGMQYILSIKGKIFVRGIEDGTFGEWVQA